MGAVEGVVQNSALIRVLKADVNETLEATLGLKPKNLGEIDFKFFKSNWLRDEKKDSAGSRGGGPQGDAKLKGSGSVAEDAAMNEVIAADDATAVKELSASAESVAQQRSSAIAVPTDAVSAATQSTAAQEAHSNRIWQSAIQNIARWSAVTRIGDVYGYFTHNSYVPDPVDDGVIDAEVVDVTYDDEVYPDRQKQLSASPQGETPHRLTRPARHRSSSRHRRRRSHRPVTVGFSPVPRRGRWSTLQWRYPPRAETSTPMRTWVRQPRLSVPRSAPMSRRRRQSLWLHRFQGSPAITSAWPPMCSTDRRSWWSTAWRSANHRPPHRVRVPRRSTISSAGTVRRGASRRPPPPLART